MSLNDSLQISMLMFLTIGGMVFLIWWKRSRQEDREFKKEELQLRKYEIDSNSRSARLNVKNRNIAPEEAKTDLNGYVFMTVEENKKSIFSEMLKGFEDYAKIKGYKISLSIDTSITDKVGFKFTLHEEGISVSSQKVKGDIQEYINNVMAGGDFENMPIIITQEEHSAVIGTLKARIKFMEYTQSLELEHKTFYQNLINLMANTAINHSPANISLIQEGIGMDSRSYSADNSANVVQGDKSKNTTENSNIQIGNNVSEINSQLATLKGVIKDLEHEATTNKEIKPVIRYLENTKEELEESSTPDSSLIQNWLEKANTIIKTANASAETISKFGVLLDVFGFSI